MNVQGLDPEQSVAVAASGRRIVCVAPAGSGKTRTLVERAAFLVEHRGLAPERLLGLTFTRAAASEMSERLAVRIGPELAAKTFFSTIHGCAFRTLATHPEWAGRRPRWGLWDEVDALDAARHCAAEAGSAQRSGKKGSRASLAELLELPGVRPRYEALLATCNALDFDSLERSFLSAVAAWDLFGEWDALLVDEYQDTSPAQDRLVRGEELGAETFVVGDPRQAIYGFRGCDSRAMLELLASPAWTRVDLRRNYRSDPRIVAFGNELLGPRFEPVLPMREPLCGGIVRTVERWRPRTLEEEAELVVRRAREVLAERDSLERSGVEIGDLPRLAVVGRTWSALRVVGDALDAADIRVRWNRRASPFESVGGRFHLRVLRCASNPLDEWSAELVARAVGMAEEEVTKTRLAARRAGVPLLDLLPDRIRNVIEGVRRRDVPHAAPADLVDDPRLPGYRAAVAACGEWVNEKTAAAAETTLLAFLEDLATGWVAPAPPEERGAPVVVTTAHSAKGLEWEDVALVGLVDGEWPGYRLEDEKLEEELRLLYVAATRARRRLAVSSPGERWNWKDRVAAEPSRLLAGVRFE